MISPFSMFQLVALLLIAAVAAATVAATVRRRMTPRAGAAWIIFWLAAAAGMAFPGVVVTIAHIAGISRGVDLVLYLGLIVTFVAFFMTYLRFRRVDAELTHIVRHIAIDEARRDSDDQSK